MQLTNQVMKLCLILWQASTWVLPLSVPLGEIINYSSTWDPITPSGISFTREHQVSVQGLL